MPEDYDGVCTCDGASVGAESWMGHRRVDVTQKEMKRQNTAVIATEYMGQKLSETSHCLWLTRGDTEYQMM